MNMANVVAGVMPGVKWQSIGIHSGDAVAFPRSIDLRDYESFRTCEEPHSFLCREIVHFTENEFAYAIAQLNNQDGPFCFKPTRWWINSFTSLKLSWWSPLPHSSWEEQLSDILEEDIGNSPALNGNSLCGPIGLVIQWKDMLENYARSRQKRIDDVEFRALGTFKYRSEIMYVVLVCIRGDSGVNAYPIINEEGTEAFKPGSTHEYFTWKVFSTVGFSRHRNPDVQWTWDHVSFGFHCPTSDLFVNPEYIRPIEKASTSYKPSSRSGPGEYRTKVSMVALQPLMTLLRRKTGCAFANRDSIE